MDQSRFDRLAQDVSAWRPDRRSVLGLAGATLAAALGLTEIETVAAACVKPGQRRCKGRRNRACCPEARCKGGNMQRPGRCVCKAGLTQCGTTCTDLNTDGANCGACGNVCPVSSTCQAGTCVGTGPQGCAAFDYCTETPPCPQAPSCYCTTDIEQNARCTRLFTPDAFCQICATNAECGAGYVCVKAATCFQCGTEGGTACIPDCG